MRARAPRDPIYRLLSLPPSLLFHHQPQLVQHELVCPWTCSLERWWWSLMVGLSASAVLASGGKQVLPPSYAIKEAWWWPLVGAHLYSLRLSGLCWRDWRGGRGGGDCCCFPEALSYSNGITTSLASVTTKEREERLSASLYFFPLSFPLPYSPHRPGQSTVPEKKSRCLRLNSRNDPLSTRKRRSRRCGLTKESHPLVPFPVCTN